MLRGSSRHDGIPNKQSAKDRDRDRQREQQRKERAQMLPDEKEIHASAQDLFPVPVKVKPSVEDTTAVQIRKTLGSFDTVRHLMIDGTNRKLANLVGVDQGLPGTPVAPHRLPSHGVEPPPYRPPISGGLNSSSVASEQNSTKSHYQRNLFPVNHHTTGISNNSSQGTTTITSNPGNSLFANSFRTSSTNPNPPNLVQKVPHSHNQLPQHNTNLFSVNTNPSAPLPPNAGPILNTRSPSLINTNNQVRSKPNLNYGHSKVNSGSVIDVSVDGVSGPSISDKNSSVFNDEPNHNNCASASNDKGSKNSSTNKKPALERADSQLELESILKEMMDVTPPLTAIQTPIKENTSTKKLPQRRSSKSEEKIVQSIIDSGMAKVPSPIKRMDTSPESSSSETDESSDSESEDSSSGSHNGGDKSENVVPQLSVVPSTSSPTPRWDLASFITKNDISTKTTVDFIGKTGSAKSPKDGKSRDSNSYSSIDSETSPGELIPNAEPSVTSTSVFNKSQSASPLENLSASNSNLANHTKVPGRSRGKADTRLESHIPPRRAPPSIPTKSKSQSSSKSKISSLTASSSDEEVVVEKPKKAVVPKSTVLEEKKTPTGGAVPRKRPRQSSTNPGRRAPKSDGDSSPETNPSKTIKKGVQDRNKSDTIRKLFRPARPKDKKVESPSAVESDTSKANNGTNNSTSGGGKSAAASNRISAKDSGRKSNSSSVVHNGDLDSSANYIGASDSGSKKKDGAKEKESSHPHSKKHPKQPHAANSHAKSTLPSPGTGVTVPSTALARVKDEPSLKSSSAPSSLIIRIPLDKLRRRPLMPGAQSSVNTISPPASKNDKELEKAGKLAVVGASTTNNTDSYRLKVPHHSSRVGSSSDPSNQPFAPHDLISRDRDDPMCSDSERLSSKNHSSKKRPKKKSRSSPKKIKIKREPDSRTKAEEDLACGEISSNLLGYAPCDSVSVTTTRTPPIESDVVQAPDSSLNPPHLPSPVIPPQVVYYSYFEKFQRDDKEDDIFSRDQDSYLQEAKKLKHSADGERTSTAQASMYLEAGLYFILTGILMERDNNLGSLMTSNAPYTMYKDTLSLIQYIGSRWRSRLENHNSLEAKIIVLSMRCQALLSLKLFKMKMKETKEMVQYMQDYFLRAPPRDPSTISSSPQLSTPSPRSPTSSPAGSSGISVLQHTPSPHHPHQNHHVTTIPRSLYAQIHKHCSNTFHVIMAHDTWEQADSIVAKHRVEEFFVGIDRQFGPLTLHSSLVDLVRYVRQGIQLINAS